MVLCRETIRTALHRRKLSWKKAKKLLGRADPERRQAFNRLDPEEEKRRFSKETWFKCGLTSELLCDAGHAKRSVSAHLTSAGTHA